MRAARDDHVVQHTHAEHLARSPELRGHKAIGAARRWVSARVKVAMLVAATFAPDTPSSVLLDARESADIGQLGLRTDRSHRPTVVDRSPARR